MELHLTGNVGIIYMISVFENNSLFTKIKKIFGNDILKCVLKIEKRQQLFLRWEYRN